MPHVPQRRKASDLYKRGQAIVLDDGDTEFIPEEDDNGPVVDEETGRPKFVEVPLPPVTMWIAKLSNNEMTAAMKFATRAQAVAMAGRRDHDSEAWQSLRETLSNVDREQWIKLIVDHAMNTPYDRRDAIEARVQHATVLDDDGAEQPGEWAKDGYLEGLYSAWVEGLQGTYAADPKDLDAMRVLSEIERFTREVDKEYEFELQVERQNIDPWPDDVVLDRAVEVLIEGEGAEAWSDEYMKRVVFLCARDCDGPDPDRPGRCLCRGTRAKHLENHFDTFEDVVQADDSIVRRIYAVYSVVQVDPAEGKGSPARPASSTLSALLATVVGSSSSSPAT